MLTVYSAKNEKGTDGQYYKIKIDVSFIQSDDPTASAAKDVSDTKFNYGNVLYLDNSTTTTQGGEGGESQADNIKVFNNVAEALSNNYNSDNQGPSYLNIFTNALREEVLHNLGGLHVDGGGLPGNIIYSSGHRDLTTKEEPASIYSYTGDNAISIFNRIGHGYNQDKSRKDPEGTNGKVEFGLKKL